MLELRGALSEGVWIYFQEKRGNKSVPFSVPFFPGIAQILALTIIYEIGDIDRFARVQQFASYARLVKCKAQSAGKTYGNSKGKGDRIIF